MEDKKCIFCKNYHCSFSEWDYQRHIWCDKKHKINLKKDGPVDECNDYAEVTFVDDLISTLVRLFIFAVLFGFMILFCLVVN